MPFSQRSLFSAVLLALAAALSAQGAYAQITTSTIVARWPGGEAAWGDIQPLLDDSQVFVRAIGGGSDSIETDANPVALAALALRLERFARENGLERSEAFRAALRQMREADWRQSALERVAESESSPTEEEIQRAYESQRSRFDRPAMAWFRYIFLDKNKMKAGSLDERRAEAERTAKALREAGDFGEMAEKISHLDAESKGALFGPARPGQLAPEIERALFAMQPGQLAGPIETECGFHFLKLEARRTARQIPYEEAKRSLRAELEAARRLEAQSAFSRRMARERPTSFTLAFHLSPASFAASNPGDWAMGVGEWRLRAGEWAERAAEEAVAVGDRAAALQFSERLASDKRLADWGKSLEVESGRENPADASSVRDERLALWNCALDRMAEAKVKHPDEAEIDKRYLETIGRFARSGGWECRLVRLYAIRRPDGQLAPVPLSAADECLGALVAKEPEEAIASRMQDHGIAVAYGEPTFVSYRGAPDGWAAPMREAKPRQWIGPFAEQDGWMLMQALEPISEGHWPLESVRPALECELKREARERARRLVLERELASIEAMDIESGGKAASRKPN